MITMSPPIRIMPPMNEAASKCWPGLSLLGAGLGVAFVVVVGAIVVEAGTAVVFGAAVGVGA